MQSISKQIKNKVGYAHRQSGAVLAIGLVVLLVLTLIGTGSINSVRMDERLTANVQNSELAFQGAEAGLIQCETDLRVSSFEVIEGVQVALNSKATVDEDGNLSRWWKEFSVWDDSTRERESDFPSFVTTEADVSLVEEPACIIEYVGNASPSLEFADAVSSDVPNARQVYRVTAFAYGADQRSSAVVESIYAK